MDTSQGLQPGQESKPWQVVVNYENNIFLTDCSKHIKIYEISGQFKGQWASSCPQESLHSPYLCGLAMDHTGNLLVGDCNNKYINKHRQDGTLLGSIRVGIAPLYIAVTSQNTIVIATWDTPPQIVSNTGQVLHTLKHPVDDSQWDPWSVYCHEDIIFVANVKTSNILCYSESGKYLGAIPIPPVLRYGGLVMTPDSKTLLVCLSNLVKVLTSE